VGEAIGRLGSPGVFTKELQKCLLDGTIDLAVHSLKDLPTDEVPGLLLTAVPKREDPRDVLVSRGGALMQLPAGATIGTGSLRRRAQILHARADLQVRDIRGNVDTRLEKLAAGQYDAVVLARAGLVRLGLESQITEVLEPRVMLPAVGQGALAIETRATDERTRSAVAPLDHAETHQAVTAERSLLAALEGGCLAPIAAWAQPDGNRQLRLDAYVLSADGKRRLAVTGTGRGDRAALLGAQVARQLLLEGAAELIREARQDG
jgi:hydroxymethylbilane synthase